MPRGKSPAAEADLERRKADWDWLLEVWREGMRPDPAPEAEPAAGGR